MKKTINLYDFREGFKNFNRGDNFTYSGLESLFEYLEELEESIGKELDFDVIAICCDYSQYTIEELNQEYGYLLNGDELPEDTDDIDFWSDFLSDHTQVIQVPHEDSLIIGNF